MENPFHSSSIGKSISVTCHYKSAAADDDEEAKVTQTSRKQKQQLSL